MVRFHPNFNGRCLKCAADSANLVRVSRRKQQGLSLLREFLNSPGRIQELLRKRALNLSSLKVLVLDEADRMLDMGFQDSIHRIIGFLAEALGITEYNR
jgi:ABC-type oligopeptide transport system ATPase subunit